MQMIEMYTYTILSTRTPLADDFFRKFRSKSKCSACFAILNGSVRDMGISTQIKNHDKSSFTLWLSNSSPWQITIFYRWTIYKWAIFHNYVK